MGRDVRPLAARDHPEGSGCGTRRLHAWDNAGSSGPTRSLSAYGGNPQLLKSGWVGTLASAATFDAEYADAGASLVSASLHWWSGSVSRCEPHKQTLTNVTTTRRTVPDSAAKRSARSAKIKGHIIKDNIIALGPR